MRLIHTFRCLVPVLAGLIFAAQACGIQSAYAGSDAMQSSLHQFFQHGVVSAGAKAELIKVLRWPEIKQAGKGSIRWSLPHLRNHPLRVSLIAEQGKGADTRRWYVPVQVRWWADALAVRDDVAARTMIMDSMLQNVHADVTGHAGRWWTDARQLAGTRTTRPLRAEQVIFESYIKRPPLLARGDRVVLVASIGGIRVTAMGKVLKQARRGDTVRVLNLNSKRMLQATVVDKHTARVFVGGI